MPELAAIRSDLPSARAAAYLNAGTFGPLPEPAAAAMRAYIDEVLERGRIGRAGYDRWMGLLTEARAALALPIGARAEEIAITHSTSDGLCQALLGIDWAAGDELVTTTHEHPGLDEPLAVLERRFGVVVRRFDPEEPDVVAACARQLGPRTRALALSHVLWTTGATLPLRQLADAAHAAGAIVIADAAQAVGAIDVAVAELGCDVYAFPGQKWLCGPSGTGALWVAPDAVEALWPAWPGYLTMDRSDYAAPRPWPGARRFDIGTVSLGALAGVTAAVRWRAQIGWSGPAAAMRAAADQLRLRLAAVSGVEVVPAVDAAPLVSFRIEGIAAQRAATALEARGILVRAIPLFEALRAAVGFWNGEDDLDRLVEAVAELAAG